MPPPDEETKYARHAAHIVFDALWKTAKATKRIKGSEKRKNDSKHMDRDQAYVWLCEQMRLTDDSGHMARMTVVQCRRVIALVKKRMGGPPKWVAVAIRRYTQEKDPKAQKAIADAVIPWFYDDTEELEKLIGSTQVANVTSQGGSK